MLLTFEKFLKTDRFVKNKGYEISKKNRLFCYNTGSLGKEFMTKNCIDIVKIYLEDTFSNGIGLIVEYQSPDVKIYGDINVGLSFTKKISCDWRKLEKILNSFTIPEFKTEVIDLYKKYFRNCILNYIENNKTFLSRCGWLNDSGDRVFLSVNWEKDFYPDIRDDFFNGIFSTGFIRQNIEEVSDKTENFKNLFSFILSDSYIFTAFIYGIHSIIWDYLYDYRPVNIFDNIISYTDTSIFSLCIYGKNITTSKIIANLFENFFMIPNNNWKIINRKYHISSTSLSTKTFDNLFLYSSVPVIITSKSNHFARNSSIMRKIHQRREELRFHIYPVYISDFAVSADEMINICSDSMTEILGRLDASELYDIHRYFCFILFSFIQYLTEISNPEKCPDRRADYYLHSNIKSIIENKHVSQEWIDSNLPELLLYSTADNFCYYLRQTPLKDYTSEIINLATECFLESEEGHCLSQIDTTENYLHHFYTFIQESLKDSKNESWVWEGQEKRDNKEFCYYLASQDGYYRFQEFLLKKRIPIILKGKLINLLKVNQILKRPKTGNSNSIRRKNINALILIKDKLNSFENP